MATMLAVGLARRKESLRSGAQPACNHPAPVSGKIGDGPTYAPGLANSPAVNSNRIALA